MKIQHKAPNSGRIFLVLTIGFFIGIFIATLDVGASTLFLDKFDAQTSLPEAILASGLLGILFTYFFAYFQNKLAFSNLSAFFILIILLIITAIRLSFGLVANNELLIFCVFICVGPVNAVVFLIFWGVYGRIFDLRESKRLIGRIDSGQLIASIISLFAIPFILSLIHDPANLLWISCISLGIIFFLLIATNWQYDIDQVKTHLVTSARTNSFATLIRNKYVVLMALFVNISMVCIFLANYSFLAVTAEQFHDPRHLANFISIYSGTIVVFNFLIQNFVTDRLINMYGLKVSLLINPVLFCLFSLFSALIGTYLGYTKESQTFLVFFMAIALSKLFATSLKDALDNPTFKLYFLPLDTSIRFDMQAKIEGVVTMCAGVIAGSLLWLIDAFAVVDRIYFTYFLIPIILCWIFIINKLHNHYRSTLEHTLEAINNTAIKAAASGKEQLIDEIVKEELDRSNPEQIIRTLKLIERIEPGLLESVLEELQHNGSPDVQAYALQKIEALSLNVRIHIEDNVLQISSNANSDISPGSPNKKRPLNTNYDPAVIKGALQQVKIHSLGFSTVIKLARSRNKSERIMAARLLSKVINADNVFILIELLRDPDADVRKSAIATARKSKRPETWPHLIDLLAFPAYSYAASVAIVEAGEKTVPVLELAFQKNSQHLQLLCKIIEIFGQIGGEKAIELLWNKIEYPDAKIVTQVLLALSKCQYQAVTEKSVIVSRLLEQEIGKAAWNQAALLEIADTPYNIYLKTALEEEMNINFDRIFILLSLIYNPQSIQLVKSNIESGTSEGKVYALELLDVFIAKNLKPILFPLLDDIPAWEEVEMYQAYFPREKLDSVEVLKHLINREYTSINRWTKACAMYSLVMTNDVEVSNDLTAQIFNPDILLRQTAAWAIYTLSPEYYQQLSERLSRQVSDELEPILGHNPDIATSLSGLLLHRVFFLQQLDMFAEVPGVVLAGLADTMKEVSFQAGQTIIARGQDGSAPLYIVVRGTVIWHEAGIELYKVAENELLGELLILDSDINAKEAVALEAVVVYSLDKEKFYHILTRYPKLVQNFIGIINRRPNLYGTGLLAV